MLNQHVLEEHWMHLHKMSADEHLRDDAWYTFRHVERSEELPSCTVVHEGTATSDDTQMVADAFANDDFWFSPMTGHSRQPKARTSGTMAASSLHAGDCSEMTFHDWGGEASTTARPASSVGLTDRHVGDTDMVYETNGPLASLRHHTSSHRPIRTNDNPWNSSQPTHDTIALAQPSPHEDVPPATARVEGRAFGGPVQPLGGSTLSNVWHNPTMAVSTPPFPAATRETARLKKTRKEKGSILRPLTPYNFFYRFERDRLLQSDTFDPLSATCRQDDPYQSILENIVDFQTKMLHEHWCQDRSVKRKHCKSHGRLSFQALTKHVAKSWRAMPEPVKQVFKAISARDQYRYALEKEARDDRHKRET